MTVAAYKQAQAWTTKVFAVVAALALTASLASCAPATVVVPTVSPAPLGFDVGTRPDFAKDMMACLSEHGWDVSAAVDGGISTQSIPNGQYDVYSRDLEACASIFGYDQPPPALSESQVREAYPHMLWEWKCLNDKGYAPSPPPSEQAYIDSYHEYGSLWTPYSEYTEKLGSAALSVLFADCPRAI